MLSRGRLRRIGRRAREEQAQEKRKRKTAAHAAARF